MTFNFNVSDSQAAKPYAGQPGPKDGEQVVMSKPAKYYVDSLLDQWVDDPFSLVDTLHKTIEQAQAQAHDEAIEDTLSILGEANEEGIYWISEMILCQIRALKSQKPGDKDGR